MSLDASVQKVAYSTRPRARERPAERRIDRVDTARQRRSVRSSGRSDSYVRLTVCCDTKVKTKLPRLRAKPGRTSSHFSRGVSAIPSA